MTNQRPVATRRARLRALAGQAVVAVGMMTALILWAVPDGAVMGVLEALRRADPWMVGAGLAVYPLIAVARGVRLKMALGVPGSGRGLWSLVKVAAVHSLLASFAPMRLGEFSLIWLLNRTVGTSVAAASATLVVMRVVDLVVVVGAGGLALAWLPAARESWPQAASLAVVAVVLLLAGLTVAPALARRLERLAPLVPGRVGRFVSAVFAAVGAMTTGRLLRMLVWTVPVWGPVFAIAWLCANAVGSGVGLAGAVAGGSATALASVLPVNGVANVGTFEAAWMLALVPAGHTAATALATGVLFHAVGLLGSAVLGLLALPGIMRGGRDGGARDGGADGPEAGTFWA